MTLRPAGCGGSPRRPGSLQHRGRTITTAVYRLAAHPANSCLKADLNAYVVVNVQVAYFHVATGADLGELGMGHGSFSCPIRKAPPTENSGGGTESGRGCEFVKRAARLGEAPGAKRWRHNSTGFRGAPGA